MERQPKLSATGIFSLLEKQFGKLINYYARRYANRLKKDLMYEDIRVGILYEMHNAYVKYYLKGKYGSEMGKILKTVPVYYFNQYYGRKKWQVVEVSPTIDIPDIEHVSMLFDKFYEKYLDGVPGDEDEKLLIETVLYNTDELYLFAKGKPLSQATLLRYFRAYKGWTKPRLHKAWEKAEYILRSEVA